ncbi:MAG: hypothetical protein KJ645_14350 [Planctomycetes bacterium]|nr:hypothetical protein [Planctomycetota bacterium]
MSSDFKIKYRWTWEEWRKSRADRRAIALRFGPPISRRKSSSSDKRLKSAFQGERGPDFGPGAGSE